MAPNTLMLIEPNVQILRHPHIIAAQIIGVENVDRHIGMASHAQRVVNLEAWGAQRARWNFTTKLHPPRWKQ